MSKYLIRVLWGYFFIITSSLCMALFASTENYQTIALGGLAGSIFGVLIVLNLIGNETDEN